MLHEGEPDEEERYRIVGCIDPTGKEKWWVLSTRTIFRPFLIPRISTHFDTRLPLS
jgi:hypothetical protein